MLWKKSKKKRRRGKIRKETVLEIEFSPKIDIGPKIAVVVVIIFILVVVGFKGDEWYNLAKIKDNGYNQEVLFKMGNETQRGTIRDMVDVIHYLNEVSSHNMFVPDVIAKVQLECASESDGVDGDLCIIDLEKIFKEYEVK